MQPATKKYLAKALKQGAKSSHPRAKAPGQLNRSH